MISLDMILNMILVDMILVNMIFVDMILVNMIPVNMILVNMTLVNLSLGIPTLGGAASHNDTSAVAHLNSEFSTYHLRINHSRFKKPKLSLSFFQFSLSLFQSLQ